MIGHARRFGAVSVAAILAATSGLAAGAGGAAGGGGEGRREPAARGLDCGYRAPVDWMMDLREAVRRGEIADPGTRRIPAIRPRRPRAAGGGGLPCLTPAQIFPFEDSDSILLTNFSGGQLLALMTDAANALMAERGDNFDFIGFWLNFVPHHTIGAAFYQPIENDVSGIGDPSTIGMPIFNFRSDMGLGGENIEGFVMMWNVNSSFWHSGTGQNADFTRLALAQEFEHRFAMFLPDLLDGRRLQGDNGSCGRMFHWNWKVDGQGSGMEIAEWVGSNPARPEGLFVSFNTDIDGGVFSFTDLYLMGYVSPLEMDLGNSELRFMEESSCDANYFGPITTFFSRDIVAAAGPRVPDSRDAQKNFRTGWIMFHRPGDPPDAAELDKAVAILEQRMIDWNFSTLGRGTMDDTSFDDCNCNGVPDVEDIARGSSEDANGNGVPDECECLGDLDGSGAVDFGDVLAILGAWGNPGGPEDLDGSGEVDFGDILVVLAEWGACD